jgi:hypothetical protein
MPRHSKAELARAAHRERMIAAALGAGAAAM